MFEDGGGSFTFLIGISFLAPLLTIGLVVLGVVAISKADFDPSGRRPYAFYLFAVCFVALFTMVYSASGAITTLTELVGDDDDSAIFFDDDGSSRSSSSSDDEFTFEEESEFDSGRSSSGSSRRQIEERNAFEDERDDEIIRTAAQAATAGLVALGLFAFHWTRARRMVDEPDFADSPASRVFNAYVYVVCFVAAITILIAGSIALYGVFRILFPEIAASSGITDDAEREDGLRQLASAAVVLAIGVLVALTHWRQIQRPPAQGAIGPRGPQGPSGPAEATPPEYTTAGTPAVPPPPYTPGDTPYQRPV